MIAYILFEFRVMEFLIKTAYILFEFRVMEFLVEITYILFEFRVMVFSFCVSKPVYSVITTHLNLLGSCSLFLFVFINITPREAY